MRGTVAIEEAVLDPTGIARNARDATLFAPAYGRGTGTDVASVKHPLTAALLDIHEARLAHMDAEGVEYMLLSLTSPGAQGVVDPVEAQTLAVEANDWLAAEARKAPTRFGALASLSMHSPADAAAELTRAVRELGAFGAILNDFQSVASSDSDLDGRRYYDEPAYDVFWAAVQDLDVPVYLHPRYATGRDLAAPHGKYAGRTHLLGAGVQFHLDLSFHLYALCSSGVFDRFPRVQVVAGHLGEGIPFNLVRADHWYNKPVKKQSRPSKEDYRYYFTHNVSITTSGNFSTQGLKFCIGELGVDRCLYAIDYPYDSVKVAQDWWKNVDLPDADKEAIGRTNAIKLFKLPLEL
ncbi:2,3-dihydroxybenzoate decarboxylase [Sporothrix schenckii 1099-18]|uniref:2,3-dihydroxybenzoate decarboxylase n=1 Tax=Sporothrix schenckii 1099-18 TaxID=1397361 RepID=A0A0F2LRV6_SPOSC|nr:2,3-dihydroxybenzoate decarboxylase [Sporothrix schenckii 1099-18]KJR80263.1 2,3-dihydroxybenzoate decarboxylase [Sporothrix schenckii 1099-18]